MNKVYYRFLSEKTGTKLRSMIVELELPTTWENVRYLFEKKQGCHPDKEARSANAGYIVGWRYCKGESRDSYQNKPHLQKEDECKIGDAFILAMMPLRIGQKPYVPQRFSSYLQPEVKVMVTEPPIPDFSHMTEDEKITCIQESVRKHFKTTHTTL